MVEIDILARLVVAAILLWAAAAKVVARDPERLEPYGVPRVLRSPGYFGLALVEAAVGAALLAGLSFAPLAAIGLGVLFTLALAWARARGFRRLDCGCFGSKERRVEVLIVRALAFTAVAGLAAFPLEVSRPSAQALVVSALVILAVAVVALAALVLALYRQVGLLTLRVGPGVALELADEAPETFERWAVPGTPFAVHIVDGVVVAKGTVNTLEQLEQLVSIGAERVERAAA